MTHPETTLAPSPSSTQRPEATAPSRNAVAAPVTREDATESPAPDAGAFPAARSDGAVTYLRLPPAGPEACATGGCRLPGSTYGARFAAASTARSPASTLAIE